LLFQELGGLLKLAEAFPIFYFVVFHPEWGRRRIQGMRNWGPRLSSGTWSTPGHPFGQQ
jgi:hypothetical protein